MGIKSSFCNSLNELSSVKSLTLAGMLLALYVALGYAANFTLTIFPMQKISLGFLPVSVAALALGPVVSAMVGGLGDLVAFLINPQGGAYFIGWTLNSAITGLIFGVFLYKDRFNLKNIIFARIVNLAIVEIFLGSLWLNIQFGWPLVETMVARAISNGAMAPFEVILILVVGKVVNKYSLLKR